MKLSINGEAQKFQGSRGGTYFLQEYKTNNKPSWIQQSGKNAIWWDKASSPSWIVGPFEYLGSSTAGILGPSNINNPPNQINNGWRYYDGNWIDTNDIQFEDITFD